MVILLREGSGDVIGRRENRTVPGADCPPTANNKPWKRGKLMRVVVTGSSGRIGSPLLCEERPTDHPVPAVHRGSHTLPEWTGD